MNKIHFLGKNSPKHGIWRALCNNTDIYASLSLHSHLTLVRNEVTCKNCLRSMISVLSKQLARQSVAK